MILKCLVLFSLMSTIYGSSLRFKPLTSSEDYTHSSVIDEDMPSQYKVFWKLVGKDEIQFEIHCKTTGWVGFGLSLNGGMTGADIAIGWVEDATGKAFLKDTHATGFVTPKTDPSQDWFLLDAAQINDYTILKVKRKLNTCDLEHDIAIKAETNYLIVAWNNADPITGMNDWKYHDSNRRNKVEFLLMFREETLPEEEEDIANAITRELRIPNLRLKKQRTFYHCQVVEQPEFDRNMHIIRYDMLFSKENQPFVHHIDFYECPYGSKFDGLMGHECGSVYPPEDIQKCYYGQQIFAWSVGGYKNYTFPRNTGLPAYKSAEKKYYMMEIHYENPLFLDGVIDNSGVKFYYTEKLRTFEVGILTLGSDERPLDLIIPPQIEGLTFTSNCYSECSSSFFPSSGITVFSGNLHTHLAGRSVSTKLVRNNRIVKYLFDNPKYDFNYQFNIEIEPIKLFPGDALVTECTYASKDRNNITFWGFGTLDEMCFDFVYYYPRLKDVQVCFTTPTTESLFNFYRSLIKDGLIPEMDLDESKYEESSEIIQMTLETKTVFTDELRARFIDYYSNVGKEHLFCGGKDQEQGISKEKNFQKFPDDVAANLDKECSKNSSPSRKGIFSLFLISLSSLILAKLY